MFTHAITRKPGPDFGLGITTSALGKPQYNQMLQQHQAYVLTLRSLGLDVLELEPLPGYPDAYFVEDPAVIVPEVAIITRPGAISRRGEADAIAPVIARFRQTACIHAPGTLEGGDVLVIEKQVLVGLSERTNREGIEQLRSILSPFGYMVTPIALSEGLHLKSGVNFVGEDTLLVTVDFSEAEALHHYRRILVGQAEAYAANSLFINGTILTPKGFPGVRHSLEQVGLPVVELNVSEPRKMDGGLTCMSLRF